MANVSITILVPTSAAAQSDPFIVGNSAGITVTCFGLQGSETATVQILDTFDNTYKDYKPAGNLIQFTASIDAMDVWASGGTYRLNKTATTVVVGAKVNRYIVGA